MLLRVHTPDGDVERHSFNNNGKSLGDMFGEQANGIIKVLVNGDPLDDWKPFVPTKNDKIDLFVEAKVIFAIISVVLSLVMAIISLTMQPTPNTPNLNNRKEVHGIAGLENTTQEGTPLFTHWGTRRIFGLVIGSDIKTKPEGDGMVADMLYFMGNTGGDGYESITDIQINNKDLSNFEGVTTEVRLGAGANTLIPGFDEVKNAFHDNRSIPEPEDPATEGTPIIYTTQSSSVDRVRLVFGWPTGIFRNKGDGGRAAAKYEYKIEHKPNGGGSWVTAEANLTIKKKSQAAFYFTYELDLPNTDKWDIRITALNDRSTAVGDAVLYNVIEIQFRTETYDNFALLAVKNIPGDQVRSLQNLRVSALSQGKHANVWNGASETLQFTDNRSWIIRDLLTHDEVGLGHRIEADEIHKQSFLDAANYWDELTDGFPGDPQEKRDRCDFLLNENGNGWDIIKTVAAEGRGVIFPSGGQWKLVVDKAGTPGFPYAGGTNMIASSLETEIGREETYNAFAGDFKNEDDDYLTSVRDFIDTGILTDPGDQTSALLEPLNPGRRTYRTLTRPSNVYRELMYEVKKSALVRRHWTFKTPMNAAISEPFDIHQLTYPTTNNKRGWNGFVQNGAATSNKLSLGITVTLDPAKTYILTIYHQEENDTSVESHTVLTGSGTWTEVNISSFTKTPKGGAIWVLGEQNNHVVDVRVKEIEGPDEQGQFKLLVSEYVPNVYTQEILPSKSQRRSFSLIPELPTPLRDVAVTEEVVINVDGSTRTNLLFSVTPGPLIEAGTAQAGASNTITLDSDAAGVDDYYNGSTIRIVAGTGVGQERSIGDYVESTKIATVTEAWNVNPDNTSEYEVEWEDVGEYGGFRVEVSEEDNDGAWIHLFTAGGTTHDILSTNSGETFNYRFTPVSRSGQFRTVGRWEKSITTVGDTSAPAAPTTVSIEAEFKSVEVQIDLTAPLAADFGGVDIELRRGSIGGTLVKSDRVSAVSDQSPSGTLVVRKSYLLPLESIDTEIWARARSVDYTGNQSAWIDSGTGATLTGVEDSDVTSADPPATPTGLSATGFITAIGLSWNLNPEAYFELAGYEVQRADDSGFSIGVVTLAFIDGLSYVDEQVGRGVTKWYRIRAVKVNGVTGSYTTGVSATTAGVDTAELVDDSITQLKIFAEAVDTSEIADFAVENLKLDGSAVTTSKISFRTIREEDIATSEIIARTIGTAQVVAGKIDTGAVSATEIEANTITGSELRTDIAVITVAAQIENALVDTIHINNASIKTAKIDDLQVTTGKIADDATTAFQSYTNDTLQEGSDGTDIGEVTITTTGEPVLIIAKAVMWPANGDAELGFELRRGGTADTGQGTLMDTAMHYSPADSEEVQVLCQHIDTPTAASHTYRMYSKLFTGGASGTSANNVRLQAIELKK